MTVRELLAQLAVLDPDLPVLVSGYEGGFEDLRTVRVQGVLLDASDDPYSGPHLAYERSSTHAVVLPRGDV